MNYSILQHVHNYSVWAAARAVQRGFTTTQNIEKAIEKTGLREFVENPPHHLNEDLFDRFHKTTSHAILNELHRVIEPNLQDKFTYGRAAKIIAIYIKTGFILSNKGEGALSKYAHPPIDRILLRNIHEERHEFAFNKVNWTNLDELAYFDVVMKLRQMEFNNFWELERYWKV